MLFSAFLVSALTAASSLLTAANAAPTVDSETDYEAVYEGSVSLHSPTTVVSACGGMWFPDRGFTVALSAAEFGSGTTACGRKIRVSYGSKTVDVTVADINQNAAGRYDLALSSPAWNAIAPFGTGVSVDWEYLS